MKQLLFTMLLFWGVAATTDAQVCKISNSNDNVEIFSAVLNRPDQVTVTVSNDSKDISANVTVGVKVTYQRTDPQWGTSTKEQTYSGKGRALPNQETLIFIDIPETIGAYEAKSVKPISISGTKCM